MTEIFDIIIHMIKILGIIIDMIKQIKLFEIIEVKDMTKIFEEVIRMNYQCNHTPQTN